MEYSRTAEIIPFPAPQITPAQRLTRALAKLGAALADQRDVALTWRDSIYALHDTIEQLSSSMQTLQVSLGELGTRNDAAHDEAVRLALEAEAALLPGT